MISRLFVLAVAAAMFGQEHSTSQGRGEFKPPPPIRIGPEHREVAEKSPVATVTLVRAKPNSQSQYKIGVGITLDNLSDHELFYEDTEEEFDVRFSDTGERAPETPFGCSINFFSECYTGPNFARTRGPIVLRIPSHSSIDTGVSYLDPDYVWNPGTYDVVGYFCAKKREGPACIKTNKITITVPPETK